MNATTPETACPACRAHADKSTWGPGPWQQEPDRVAWEHAGLPCIAHRGGGGCWCGYAGVPPGHPLHGKDYGEAEDAEIGAHGGLTYAAPCHGCICHVARPGEPDDVWWFGFDCYHAGDFAPALQAQMRSLLSDWSCPDDVYRDLPYVQAETNRLAEQLAALAR